MQDALGNLPPSANPFIQQSELLVYDFARPEPLRLTLRAADGDGQFFADAALSADGETVMAVMRRPARFPDRAYPIATYPDKSSFRFLAIDIARTYHDVLTLNGVPVTLLEFAGEGHGLDRPANPRAAARAQIAFFREYPRPAG